MSARETDRPAAPDCCGEPGCAHDPTTAPTRPAPGPCQVVAGVALLDRIERAQRDFASLPEDVRRRAAARHRRAAGRCSDCGHPSREGEARCFTCEVARIERGLAP